MSFELRMLGFYPTRASANHPRIALRKFSAGLSLDRWFQGRSSCFADRIGKSVRPRPCQLSRDISSFCSASPCDARCQPRGRSYPLGCTALLLGALGLCSTLWGAHRSVPGLERSYCRHYFARFRITLAGGILSQRPYYSLNPDALKRAG